MPSINPEPLKNRAIVVLGMHRSGTSAFTGLLGLLGVDLGPRLMPATGANESGYWEHADIVTLHDQLLLQLGSHWDDPSRLPPGWTETEPALECRRQIAQILTRDFAASKLWAVKDPRMCRLLPMWTSLLDELSCQTTWVLLTRHPAENTRSLEKRDGFSAEKSALLWLQHTLDAEWETRGRKRVVITYEQLFADLAATLARVQRLAGIEWPASPAEEEIRRFIDPTKRHHSAAGAELPQWLSETYTALLAGAAEDEPKMQALIDPPRQAFEIANALYRPVIRGRAADLDQKLTEAGTQLAAVSDARAETKRKYMQARKSLAEKTAEATALKKALLQFERSPGGKLNRLLGRSSCDRAEEPAIDFPAPEDPIEISIIVSAGKDASQTTRCLRAIREESAPGSYEVIVVGEDAALEPLRQWKNIETLPAEAGLSFGEPHNRAAQKARGQFLIFLDNSVIVQPGWSEAILGALQSRPDAGLVGAEAGTLSRDGSVKLIDAGDSGNLHEADFCTTACLGVPRNLFFQAGGFDTFYLPVEEANLAMKIRQTRHRIYHLPACPVLRPETARPIDPERMESSREKFVRRWADALAQYA